MLITKFLFIFYLCSRTPPPPHPHPPKRKKNNRERLLLSTFYSMIKLCCLNRQQPLSFFFCSMFHTLLRSINSMLFIKLTDVKRNCTCDVKIHTSFTTHLPQGIYNILCFAKVYIIQSISHLVFHFLKKEKEKKKCHRIKFAMLSTLL